MSTLGIWDDKWGMRPIVKLFGQILAASLLFFTNVRIEALGNAIQQVFGHRLELFGYDAANYFVTVFWVVAVTNALNLMDNMDGLAGGIAAVASTFFFLIATLTNQNLIAPLAAVLVGACLGFLYYNFNPARIFMGDTGSLFLGFMLAAVGIKLRFPANTDMVTWMVPVLVLGVPLFDTTLVTLSRIRRGIPISRGGKDHLSHRLVALGFTRREAVLILYLVQGALGVAALVVMQADLFEGYMVGLVVFICAVFGAYKLEQIDLTNTNPAPPGKEHETSRIYRLIRRRHLRPEATLAAASPNDGKRTPGKGSGPAS
jgi:UDP-GlcNAc:undecaprenyl-phosphate GlcNAc-1-phosphate transferase